ncbi:DUF58 domain-containing protein [Salinifilum ghardaiensis]
MLSGLTLRGRCLLAAGLAAVVSALLLDERDLLRVAAFVLALPLLAATWTLRTRRALRARREVAPARVEAGQPVRVRLEITATSRLPSGGLVLSDHTPHGLPAASHFRLDALPRHAPAAVHYTVHPRLRGHYRLGPLTTRVADPLGMSEAREEIAGPSRLTVLPRTVPLRGMSPGAGHGQGARGRSRPHPGQGVEDAMVREYRRGDDMRRVHWKSTARRQELMVRVDEHPWHGGTTVLLDRRGPAHRGSGAESSVEWAVSAAASIWLHLRASGRPVQLITEDDQQLDTAAAGPNGDDRVLDALAGVRTSAHRDLGFTDDPGDGQELIAVLGELTAPGVAELSRLRPEGTQSLALLLDVGRWSGQPFGGADPYRAADRLRASGWTAVVATPGTSVAAAWQLLCSAEGAEAAEGVTL